MQPSRIRVTGSSPLFISETEMLQQELDATHRLVQDLRQQIKKKDEMFNEQYIVYKTSAEEHDAKMNAWTEDVKKTIEEERKRHLLERKAADDEIVRLRNERDHLISVTSEVRRIASAMTEYETVEEPKTKKARLCGSIEFDSSFFDEASVAWNANKKRNGPGYVYKCIVPKCDRDGEFDFDMCCYECFDKVCRNGSCKIKVTSKKKRGYCNECFETSGY